MVQEIKEEILKVVQSKRELRKFGFTFSVVFLFFALVVLYRRAYLNEMGYCWVTLSLVFFVLTWRNPSLMKYLHKPWMAFSIVLGHVSSCLVLFLLFFGVITPISWLLRILKKDVLELKPVEKESHWATTNKVESKEQYSKMF